MNVTAASTTVAASGMVLLAEAIRRRIRVPRYVHAVAIGSGLVAGVILWRGGGLYSSVLGNTLKLLVPSAAIYYFFFRDSDGATAQSADVAGERDNRTSRPDV